MVLQRLHNKCFLSFFEGKRTHAGKVMENNDIEIVNCKNCNIKPEFSSKYFFNLLKYYLNHQIYLVSLKLIKSFSEIKTEKNCLLAE